jgi:dienelactone hydrolase
LSYQDYVRLAATEENFGRGQAEIEAITAVLVRGWYETEAGPAQARTELAGVMRARRDAAPAPGKFPVVIYAPSFGASPAENVDLCEYLASQGYLVIASPSMGLRSRGMTDDLEGIETQAADIAFLISYAHTLPQADVRKFAVAGFSWGGIANVFAAAKDNRIKALVNLDGSVRYFPELVTAAKYVTPTSVSAPMLFVAARPQSLEQIAARGKPVASFLNEMKYADFYKLTMHPMEHFAFSSEALRFMSEAAFTPYSRADVNRAYGWTVTYVHRFLDAYLKDDQAAKQFLAAPPAKNGIPAYMAALEVRLKNARPPSRETLAMELAQRGFEHAHEAYKAMRGRDAKFELKETELNSWGYSLLRSHRTRSAIEIFKLATVLYPDSANTYDSLGEAYAEDNDKPRAIENYRRSLQLNPENRNAARRLDALGAPAELKTAQKAG